MDYFTIYVFLITSAILEKLSNAEVILMAKNPNKTQSGTNVQHVKQQNQKAAQGQQQAGQGQYGTEFASETNAQEVRKQNQKSQQNKK